MFFIKYLFLFFNALYNILCDLILIPFIIEYFLMLLCFCYLILCCFIKTTGWHIHFVYNFFKLIKSLFYLLLISYCLFYYRNININSSLFFGEYLSNDYFILNIKFFLCFLFLICYYYYQQYVLKYGQDYKVFTEHIFWILGLFLFLFLLISVYDFIAMFFLIIGMNICLYGLIIQNCLFQKVLNEVCLKYFLLSALSSILFGGGCLFIYFFCGTTNFLFVNNFLIYKLSVFDCALEFFPFKIAFFLIFFSFLFKLAIAPVHFWAPEVYEGLPFALLTIIILPIKFIFSLLFLRVFGSIFHIFMIDNFLNFIIFYDLNLICTIICILSMFFGSINAIFEQKIKRFIAYSSLTQFGFLIICLFNIESTINNIQIFLYFLFVYIFNLLFFLIVLFFYDSVNIGFYDIEKNEIIEIKNNPIIYFSDLKMKINLQNFIIYFPNKDIINMVIWKVPSIYNLLLGISILSFAGIPPFPGFFTKFYILIYALKLKYFFVLFFALSTSLLSAFYYLLLLKKIFFDATIIDDCYREYFIYFFSSFKIKRKRLWKILYFLFFVLFCFIFFIFMCFFCSYFIVDSYILLYFYMLACDFLLLKT